MYYIYIHIHIHMYIHKYVHTHTILYGAYCRFCRKHAYVHVCISVLAAEEELGRLARSLRLASVIRTRVPSFCWFRHVLFALDRNPGFWALA